MSAEVSYQIGTYAGHVTVPSSEADEDETLIARAKRALQRKCGGISIYPGSPCYESWKVSWRQDDDS